MDFKSDHLYHVEKLHTILQDAGKYTSTKVGIIQLIAQGKVLIAGLMNDKIILKAMGSNEKNAKVAYRKLVSFKNKSEKLDIYLTESLEEEKGIRIG
jgi:hypothetical protein